VSIANGLEQQMKNNSFVQSNTKHHFLANCEKVQLQLNFNGITRVSEPLTIKLGQHPLCAKPRLLTNVVQKSGPIAMLDVVVSRRYPVYYSEYAQNPKEPQGQSLRYTRSRETAELIMSR
jgi:hypothetical protein